LHSPFAVVLVSASYRTDHLIYFTFRFIIKRLSESQTGVSGEAERQMRGDEFLLHRVHIPWWQEFSEH
jgi:hypothetical protein